MEGDPGIVETGMKILLVIHALTAGGAERVCAAMANYWARNNNEVHIVINLSADARPFYELDKAIELVPLGICEHGGSVWGKMQNTWLWMRNFRRVVKTIRPDIVISYMHQTNVFTILGLLFTGTPVLACEHNYPKGEWAGWVWEGLRWGSYPFADSVVALTQSGLRCFSSTVVKRGTAIPNAVTVPKEFHGAALARVPEAARGVIFAMGRLTEQKGFDRLIEAFAIIAGKHPDWTLVIWGDGVLRKDLESLVREHKLGERVKLPGLTSEAYARMCEADLYVLSSRWEGWPMVVGEAMACGLPVISYDCQTGPAEIIKAGVNGCLVPPDNVAALAETMEKLIEDPALRRRLAVNATAVVEHLGQEKIMQRWKELIESVLKRQ